MAIFTRAVALLALVSAAGAFSPQAHGAKKVSASGVGKPLPETNLPRRPRDREARDDMLAEVPRDRTRAF